MVNCPTFCQTDHRIGATRTRRRSYREHRGPQFAGCSEDKETEGGSVTYNVGRSMVEDDSNGEVRL